MAKSIALDSMVIVPEFSNIHIYKGVSEESPDAIVYDLAHRWVYAPPEKVAPVAAMRREHEVHSKLYVRKTADGLYAGHVPSGQKFRTKLQRDARAMAARLMAIADWHSEDSDS